MNAQPNSLPGGFPGSSSPSFEEPEDQHTPNTPDETHVHFDDDSEQLGAPPRDISQDTEEVIFFPDPDVPQPGESSIHHSEVAQQQPNVPPAPLQGFIHDQGREAPQQPIAPPRDPQHHHQQRQHQGSPPQQPHQRAPPHQQPRRHQSTPPPPARAEYPVARPLEPTYLPPGAYGSGQPPMSYEQPPFDPYGQSGPPSGPWLQDPGIHHAPPFGGPPPWIPPPRQAEFHHSHQQIRRRVPRRAPPPVPIRVRPPIQQQPVQIQVQEQQVPQIQVQHIPAPQNNNGNGNGNMMSDAMQMMMMNQMMSQQMNAQQMQAAQFGAMIGGVNGRGGGSEVTAQASCGGTEGGNVQNCQNQAMGNNGGGNGNPRRQRRRRVRKRGPKAIPKPRGGLKIQVGQPRPPGVPPPPFPPPPRINAPLPPPPVESLVADNWQEATIILCLAVVALIYLMASRAGGSSSSGSKPASGSSTMSRPAR